MQTLDSMVKHTYDFNEIHIYILHRLRARSTAHLQYLEGFQPICRHFIRI